MHLHQTMMVAMIIFLQNGYALPNRQCRYLIGEIKFLKHHLLPPNGMALTLQVEFVRKGVYVLHCQNQRSVWHISSTPTMVRLR